MNALSEAAILAQNLARNCGYAVFPCKASDKKPFKGSHGFKDAVRDPGAIAALWRRHPGELIGVATGAASGVDLLDVDIKHPPACAWWREACDRVPRTQTYRTRGGGFHLYFQHAPGVRNDQGRKICPGVDVRGDGGYLIFWFATGLECLDNTPPAPWPEWLLQIVRPPPRPTAPPRPLARPHTGPDRGIPVLLHRVAAAPEGQRNGLLYWASRRLAERIVVGRIRRAEAEAELLRAALSCGLPEPEARRTIQSGLRSAS